MKVMISIDLEGGAAIVGQAGQPLTGGAQYELAQRILTGEANAAVEGALAAGAADIIVNDCHGAGLNLLYEALRPEARILLGTPRPRRFWGLEGSDALFLIGYHPMAGAERGVLAHSYSSVSIQNMWLNGRRIGEIGFDAALAGQLGVPVALVTSCTVGCAEAEDFIPGVETVATKEGLGRNCALSLHPRRACDLIRQAATRALELRHAIAPFVAGPPYTVRREFKLASAADGAEKNPDGTRIDARTLERTSDDLFQLI
ncbi:M55 family metallopeptidase [bacterium]|nr:M55 family metallopeptidase [bacterium]